MYDHLLGKNVTAPEEGKDDLKTSGGGEEEVEVTQRGTSKMRGVDLCNDKK